MRLFWRVGPDAWHGASASSTHSTATTVTSSKPPRKKYRPSRALHRLAHVFSERKITPAHSKLAKNSTFTHAGAKNISQNPTAPPTGAVFLSSQSDPYPTSAKKFALLASISVHTRKSSPSTAKTVQNQRFFACRANFFAVCSRIHSCWASIFALMGATATSQHPPTTSPETDDTSARTKQPNSGRFPPAKVSRVSCTPRRVPAKASPVSPSPDATPTAQTSRGVRTRHKAGGTLAT